MTALKILCIVLIIIGAIINYAASIIVKRFKISERVKVKEAGEFTGEELEKYKQMKALSMVKLTGFAVLFPGIILVFFAFR